MTSHVKKGHNIYNGAEAPEYNVLSYTWGYYQDFDSTSTTEVLAIQGVDWKIPRIKKDHFTASSFQKAIQRAAQGVYRSCEWLWVDIACIPQEHEGEPIESIALRGQEIGRQVEIFQRAQEAFAWLSSLKTADFTGGLETVDSHLAIINQHTPVFPSVQVANHFLHELDQCSRSFEAWMWRVLGHPWLQSLWTLQEMILRPDAYIMFDDGFLFLDQSEQNQARPWNFNRVLADVSALQMILTDRRMTDLTRSAEALVTGSDAVIGLQTSRNYHTMITQRLQRLLDLQEDRGLAPLKIEFPHTAYSLSQRRRATKPKDRIYGIVQTYGISCSPFPQGKDETSKLHALEDEFGTKLVARSPLLSQIFIHSSADRKPRRSWLITQECKVNDWFWMNFTTEWQVQDHFKLMRVIGTQGRNDMHDIHLRLETKSWFLTSFVESGSSSSQRCPLFCPARPGMPQYYRGLMLDYHVSKSILGRVVDYFDDLESMCQSVQALEKHYQHNRARADIEKLGRDSTCLRVALLGSGYRTALPVVDYIGLVLAPLVPFKMEFPGVDQDQQACSGQTDPQNPGIMVWERIGLMRWTEIYHEIEEAPHRDLPPHHDFEYLVA